MFKPIAIAFLVMGSSAYAAEAPFGKNVTGKSLTLGVDKCSSTELVNQAVIDSGINFVDGKAKELFSCEQLEEKEIYANSGTLSSACRDKKKVRCYSNGGNVSVCVVNPRQVDLDKDYGDTGKVVDHRARFDSLFIFSKDAAGNGKERSWQMDPKGCDPTAANMNNPMDSESKCLGLVMSFVSGGSLSPVYNGEREITPKKFCGGELSSEVFSSIDRLHNCLESYPQLRYARAAGSGGGDGQKPKEAAKIRR